MATKMKGLFKGLRYISQIFEEDKDQEMQIGFPTDVKHVAHIGWDGPSATVDSSPSWMKDFKSPTRFQSGPLDSNGNNRDDHPEIKWVSEDSKKGNRATDTPDVPRSSRRHSSDNSNDSPRKKDSSTKSRRNHSKDSSDGSVKSSRGQTSESDQRSDSPSKAHPDLAKKSRRRKSKESDGGGSTRTSRSKDSEGGGSTRSRSKDSEGSGSSRSRSKPVPCGPSIYSDPGPESKFVSSCTLVSTSGPISSMHDEENERRLIS